MRDHGRGNHIAPMVRLGVDAANCDGHSQSLGGKSQLPAVALMNKSGAEESRRCMTRWK